MLRSPADEKERFLPFFSLEEEYLCAARSNLLASQLRGRKRQVYTSEGSASAALVPPGSLEPNLGVGGD